MNNSALVERVLRVIYSPGNSLGSDRGPCLKKALESKKPPHELLIEMWRDGVGNPMNTVRKKDLLRNVQVVIRSVAASTQSYREVLDRLVNRWASRGEAEEQLVKLEDFVPRMERTMSGLVMEIERRFGDFHDELFLEIDWESGFLLTESGEALVSIRLKQIIEESANIYGEFLLTECQLIAKNISEDLLSGLDDLPRVRREKVRTPNRSCFRILPPTIDLRSDEGTFSMPAVSEEDESLVHETVLWEILPELAEVFEQALVVASKRQCLDEDENKHLYACLADWRTANDAATWELLGNVLGVDFDELSDPDEEIVLLVEGLESESDLPKAAILRFLVLPLVVGYCEASGTETKTEIADKLRTLFSLSIQPA